MKSPYFRFSRACAFLLLLLWATISGAGAQGYSQVFILGDSLSDDGNLYHKLGGLYPPSPPYYMGRFSNGPVWVEDLVPKMGLTFNAAIDYAFGGAETGTKNAAFGLPGMQQQLTSLLKAYPTGDPAALYIVWGGGNDYLDGQTNTMTPVTNLMNLIKSLAATGARNFFVPNLPDLGQTPGNRNTANAASLTQRAMSHNANLAAAIQTLRAQLPTSNIVLFDTYTEFNRILANPATYGFTNTTDEAMQATGSNPDTYLFWDDVHPTAAAHRLIASDTYAALFTTVSGTATLEGLAATAAPQPVMFQFRPDDGTANFSRTAAIDATGAFTLTGIPAKQYNVWLKGATYLATVVALDTTGGMGANMTTTLLAGDANGDNTIDIADFGILTNAYNSSVSTPDSGYDARADFNADGGVDIADFGLLVNNYGLSGAL